MELLPCPFCGGEAEMVRTGTPRRSCQVACSNCNTHHESADEGEDSGASWNTRTFPAQSPRAEEASSDPLASIVAPTPGGS